MKRKTKAWLFLVSYRPLAKSRWQSFRRSTAIPSGDAAVLSRSYDSHDTSRRLRRETTPRRALQTSWAWQPQNAADVMCVAPPKPLTQQPTARRRSTIVEDQLRKHKKSFQSFAAFVGLLLLLRSTRRESFEKLTNPLDLSREYYWAGWALKCLGLQLLDHIVLVLLERAYSQKMMMYRINTGNRGLVKLEWIDYLFLCINSVVEWQFTCHVIDIVLSSPNFAWRLSDLGMLNTLPALYLIFAIDDAFYAPLHLLMHRPWFYPYVHKHHHRQQLPERGYADAGNEHPIEQVLGLSCLYITLVIVGHTTSVHALTIFVHFILYAILALLNHTAYDVQFRFWGFEYTTRAHETHHRYPTKNLAQYFMFWDKLYGTYKEYYDGADRKKVA